jgi:hypothetical protein
VDADVRTETASSIPWSYRSFDWFQGNVFDMSLIEIPQAVVQERAHPKSLVCSYAPRSKRWFFQGYVCRGDIGTSTAQVAMTPKLAHNIQPPDQK